jgi:hypothetical protein
MEWKDLSNRTGKKKSLKVVRITNAWDEDAKTQEHVKRVLRHQNSETVKKRTE